MNPPAPLLGPIAIAPVNSPLAVASVLGPTAKRVGVLKQAEPLLPLPMPLIDAHVALAVPVRECCHGQPRCHGTQQYAARKLFYRDIPALMDSANDMPGRRSIAATFDVREESGSTRLVGGRLTTLSP